MNTKRALVTGGLGFIGSNLTRALLDSGDFFVDIVDNMSGGRIENKTVVRGSMIFYYDFADDLILEEVRRGKYDYVFHLAATPRVGYSVERPSETTDNNLNKTVKLLESCNGNVGRFIFSSSSSVVGDTNILPTPVSVPKNPQSPYAMQKSHCEDYIKLFCDLYDLDALILRYFNVFGPGAYDDSSYAMAIGSWCSKIKKGEPLRSDGDGEQSRDWTYVDNVVQANVNATKYIGKFKGDVYNVGCGENFTNNEILTYLKNKYTDIDIVNAPARVGDVRHTCADINRTKKNLGYNPTIDFWTGIKKTLEWWKI